MAGPDHRCEIVICDDQAAFRQVLLLVLTLEDGLEVVGEARDGLEAIELAGELRPHVLVLDIAMPKLDGLEALPRIRAASPETRIVMLTGIVTSSARERAQEGGAATFVEKGTDIRVVVRHIRDACGCRAA